MNRIVFILLLPFIALLVVIMTKLTNILIEREDSTNMWRSATIKARKGVWWTT